MPVCQHHNSHYGTFHSSQHVTTNSRDPSICRTPWAAEHSTVAIWGRVRTRYSKTCQWPGSNSMSQYHGRISTPKEVHITSKTTQQDTTSAPHKQQKKPAPKYAAQCIGVQLQRLKTWQALGKCLTITPPPRISAHFIATWCLADHFLHSNHFLGTSAEKRPKRQFLSHFKFKLSRSFALLLKNSIAKIQVDHVFVLSQPSQTPRD